jgi:putative component of membrane protein insertase Oxa1/YidC/SpoIIIJ protein YidD
MVFKIFILFPFCLFAFYEEPWGIDSELNLKPRIYSKIDSPGSYLIEKVIEFHQKVISPVDGPRSHFRPTSSQYMKLAVHKYGFFKGVVMGFDRLLRENSDPWIYRTIEIDGIVYKYDPARFDKSPYVK